MSKKEVTTALMWTGLTVLIIFGVYVVIYNVLGGGV